MRLSTCCAACACAWFVAGVCALDHDVIVLAIFAAGLAKYLDLRELRGEVGETLDGLSGWEHEITLWDRDWPEVMSDLSGQGWELSVVLSAGDSNTYVVKRKRPT